MIRRSFAVRSALLALALAVPASAAVTPYRVSEPVVRSFANGMTVAVRVDHRLPVVHMQLMVPAGSAMESALEPGLASFTAGLLPRGTASRSTADITAQLARLGASIDGNAGREVATLSGLFGAGDVETGLELLADMALHPSFPEDAIEVARARQSDAVARARQDPAVLADEHVNGVAFAGDALGHPPSGIVSAIDGFGLPQAQDFHRRFWRPDHALLAVAGDVDPDRVLRLAEEQFGEWGGKSAPPPPRDTVAAPGGLRIRLVDVPGASRCEIRLALPGPAKSASDGDALALACQLLGGGADSRLARAGAGLTPRASWSGFRERGLVVLGTSALADSVLPAVRLMRGTLRDFAGTPPGEDELAPARRRMAEGYALGFETLGGWIAQWLSMRVYGLPADQLQRFPERVNALTAADVATTARRWFSSDAATLVVAGPAQKLRGALVALGEVEVVAATSAPVAVTLLPSQRSDPPSPDAQTRGRELVGLAFTAHGGRKTIERIPDSVLEGSITLGSGSQAVTGTFKELRRLPDRYLIFTLLQNVPNQAGLIGSSGWILGGAEGDSAVTADSSEVADLRSDFHSDLQHILLAAGDPSARVAVRGREWSGQREFDVVEVLGSEGDRRVLFLTRTITASRPTSRPRSGRMGARRRCGGSGAITGRCRECGGRSARSAASWIVS